MNPNDPKVESQVNQFKAYVPLIKNVVGEMVCDKFCRPSLVEGLDYDDKNECKNECRVVIHSLVDTGVELSEELGPLMEMFNSAPKR